MTSDNPTASRNRLLGETLGPMPNNQTHRPTVPLTPAMGWDASLVERPGSPLERARLTVRG
jgi:hypothetical protein